jgi:hypothetical protein
VCLSPPITYLKANENTKHKKKGSVSTMIFAFHHVSFLGFNIHFAKAKERRERNTYRLALQFQQDSFSSHQQKTKQKQKPKKAEKTDKDI